MKASDVKKTPKQCGIELCVGFKTIEEQDNFVKNYVQLVAEVLGGYRINWHGMPEIILEGSDFLYSLVYELKTDHWCISWPLLWRKKSQTLKYCKTFREMLLFLEKKGLI